ncbi:MAG TPA: beta-ketoacyl-[acyl-carrier-protein] synthase family protein [Anaeromyxobacteraceae bacterium]|nr:beta-ketoacyl-[acyl-carrier-protein] synthase family protein [Anaeromyxobacteraceae bacterium]
MRRRVVIAGCGVVTAAGTELEPFWRALMAGTCFIGPLRNFSVAGMEPLTGTEVELPEEDARQEDARGGRCAQLALAAARRALADAGLARGAPGLEGAGVVIGTTLGEERQVGELDDLWPASGVDGIDPGFFSRSDNHRLATLVARTHGLSGPTLVSATACSSGNAAIAWGYELVSSGAADIMVVGGADALTRSIYTGFLRMGALSKSICHPFDRRLDGVSFGEGAGVLVIEELEHARRRGASARAELAGYGVSNDAHHITAPDPNGEGTVAAMRQALATSGTTAEEVDYVSAHGTGTPYNDVAETKAMKAIFGERARQVPISSIKSMLGHTNGAASAIEAVACTLALRHQAVPPTANLGEPHPDCDLDYVPMKGRAMPVATCLNLSAGFGGFNVCVVIKRAP